MKSWILFWIDMNLNNKRDLWIPFRSITMTLILLLKIKSKEMGECLNLVLSMLIMWIIYFHFFNICLQKTYSIQSFTFYCHTSNRTKQKKIGKIFIFTFLDCPRGFSIWGFKLNRNIHSGVRKIGQRKMC